MGRPVVLRPFAAALGLALAALLVAGASSGAGRSPAPPDRAAGVTADGVTAAVGAPNIFIYHLDDLRDALPGGIDPLQFMPKTRAWMAAGTRYTQSFVNDPSCCPSRASMLTGRYPHNNGVVDQQDGALFPPQYSLACYLDRAGYSTYVAGKFLTTWPKTQRPPCFDHSTVMWSGYNNVKVRVDGVARTSTGYSTTYLGTQGRDYVTQALATPSQPFLLYETPQAPHWVNVTVNGATTQLAVPEATYAEAPVGSCAGVPEADRSDKPAYVRKQNYSTARAQAMCASQLRAIMSADDQFAATMQLLSDRGVLDDTLVILSSDNGYHWGEHGRWEKFTPYEPSIRTPLMLRWPGHVPSGTDTTRLVTLVDILPTVLQAAGVAVPAAAPAPDGESILEASRRTAVYAEYDRDEVANPNIPSWTMIRTASVKYVEVVDDRGVIVAREYYDLTRDPNELLNVLGDSGSANDPPAATVSDLAARLHAFTACSGSECVG